MHLVIALELVSRPRTALQWGVACVGVGFGLLLLCLITSVYWRRRSVRLVHHRLGDGPQQAAA